MKQTLHTALTMMGALLIALSLSSCSDDQDTAYYLAGRWEGVIDDDRDQYSAVFYFNQYDDYSTSGTGWEYDSALDGYYYFNRSEAPFHWWVRDQRIIIQYDDYSDLRVILDSNVPQARYDDYMAGYFVNYDTGQRMAAFRLQQTAGNSKANNMGVEKE